MIEKSLCTPISLESALYYVQNEQLSYCNENKEVEYYLTPGGKFVAWIEIHAKAANKTGLIPIGNFMFNPAHLKQNSSYLIKVPAALSSGTWTLFLPAEGWVRWESGEEDKQ